MLHQERPPSEYRATSGTERPRHVQWRKLSKKRKRKIVQRSLKHLEKKAKKKSLNLGLDDYSHVVSLVYSQLPYNPNGHHCSCNCIDEIIQAPDLAIDGLQYGKNLTAGPFEYGNGGKGPRETEELNYKSENSSVSFINRSGTQSKQGDSKAGAISDLGVSPRQVCHKCKYVNCGQNSFKEKGYDNRRLSLAKQDGSLRSKIFGLRRKIRQYTDEIENQDSKTVQAIVNRKYSIAEQQQLQALNLSDELRALKVKEMLYRSENAHLKQRIAENDDAWRNDSTYRNKIKDKHRMNSDLACKTWLENIEVNDPSEFYQENEPGKKTNFSHSSSRRLSNKSTGRMSNAYQLPALIEEEEEMRNSADIWKENRLNNENRSMSYDILWINHDNDYDGESDENSEDEDTLYKTWPMFAKDHAGYEMYEIPEGDRRSSQSDRTMIIRKSEDLNPVKKIVHRLESGLTFGLSSPTRQVLDESLIGVKDKIDDVKLAGSKLSEDQYYKPLYERQASFGNTITKTIQEGISKRGSLAAARRNSSVSDSELEKEDDKLKDEVTRRRSLVVDEKNIQAFIKEAELKDKAVKNEIRKRSVVSLGGQGSEFHKDLESSDHADHVTDISSDADIEENQSELNNDIEKEDSQNGMGEERNVRQDFAMIAGKTHVVPKAKLYDLSALKTVAQKHQTLRTLARLDEDFYKVSDGTEKLNKYRKNEAKAKISKEIIQNTPRDDDGDIPMTRKERIFSIPEPMNTRLLVESDVAHNDKVISKLDFKYDMIRDLRFLIMNQNTSREFSYSYLKPAPPYLKTKWENRIKRGFLRGVKEQKINENELETVEGVTYKVIDRDVIHSETLKRSKGKRKISGSYSSPQSRNSASRVSTSRNSVGRRSSTALSIGSGQGRNFQLPPLQLPSSRTPSPMEITKGDDTVTSRSSVPGNLNSALRKLSIRHKYQEKEELMRNVIRLSAYEKNVDQGDNSGTDMPLSTNRTMNGNEPEENYTPRLNTSRRHSTFVQNIATSNSQTGRLSASSYDDKRKMSLMNTIIET